MNYFANPAGRLYDILMRVCKSNQAEAARAVWAKELGIDDKDTYGLLANYVYILELVVKTRRCIERLTHMDVPIHLAQFAKVEKAFSKMNFDEAFGPFKSLITDTALHDLRTCATQIQLLEPEKAIEQVTLDELSTEIASLIVEVTVSEFEPDLKALLLRHLEELREAIEGYRIRGTDGLRRVMEVMLGSFTMRQDLVKPYVEEPILVRFKNLLRRVNEYVEPMNNLRELISPIMLVAIARSQSDQPK